MKCEEKECKGEINEANLVCAPVGCLSIPPLFAYPCRECGRLYRKDGSPLFDNSGNKAFLEGDEIIFRDKNNQNVESLKLS